MTIFIRYLYVYYLMYFITYKNSLHQLIILKNDINIISSITLNVYLSNNISI